MVLSDYTVLKNAVSIAIGGHVRPDGDCIGSCLGLSYYLKKQFPEKKINVYLEYVQEEFKFLAYSDMIKNDIDEMEDTIYDVFVALDCGDQERLGFSKALFANAKNTISIDHHITNKGFADYNEINSQASSTAEILYGMMDKQWMDKELASALYLGIVHDTGVFKHSNTTKETMEAAGDLIQYGIPFSKIIDETFFQKTYVQNQILGRCLLESFLILEGQCIIAYVKRSMMDFYHAGTQDLDGVIDQLRITKGVEVAVLIHETGVQNYKVSMRSNDFVDVSEIAKFFGGGGHVKAAGCTITGSIYDVINNITVYLEEQLKK